MRSFSQVANEVPFDQLEDLGLGRLVRMRKLFRKQLARERKGREAAIAEQLKDDASFPADDLRDLELEELQAFQDAIDAQLALSTYQRWETRLGAALDVVNAPKNPKAQHGESPLSARLRALISDCASRKGAAELDELRHLVNAWKHDGTVSDRLHHANALRWPSIGAPIDGIGKRWKALRKPIADYASEIGAELRALHRAQRSPTRPRAGRRP